MSTHDFNFNAQSSITITISGEGQFSPFDFTEIDWTLGGTVSAIGGSSSKPPFTCKQIDPSLTWTRFNAPSSNGGQSGYIDTGVIPFSVNAETQFGRQLGSWTVNTKPILSSEGYIDGDLSGKGYYVVNVAKDKTEDDFIDLPSAIDGITRVYPGDWIYSTPTQTGRKWNVFPNPNRQPKTDRTLFWEPNTDPYVEENGMINGELAKPGTIILPTKDYDFEDSAEPFYLRYAQNKIGWMFNGYSWIGGSPPYKYQPPDNGGQPKPAEYRFLTTPSENPSRYAGCLHQTHFYKPFWFTNQRIDDSQPVVITFIPKPIPGQPTPPPYSMDMIFRLGYGGDEENYIQPRGGIAPIFNFGDVLSKFHQRNIDWMKQRQQFQMIGGFCTLSVTPTTDPPMVMELYYECAENGNTTKIINEITTPDGIVLKNEVTVSLSMSVTQS